MEPRLINLPVEKISKIGKVWASRLKRLGIKTIEDLLYHLPFRYDDLSKISKISQAKIGEMITIRARIEFIENKRTPRKRMIITSALVSDETGQLPVVWFNQPFLTQVLKPGDIVYLSGRLEYGPDNLQLTNPTYEKFKEKISPLHTARLVPIYPLTTSLTQKQMRFFIKLALNYLPYVKDFLPYKIKKERKLINLPLALKQIHFPDSYDKLKQARYRLKFDELFLFQLKTLKAKVILKKSLAYKVPFNEKLTKKFVQNLPFNLTQAQRKAAFKILKDLEKRTPMNRLLVGDVGSGKTIVAAIAMLNVSASNFQSVLMAPTEILAFQHFKNLSSLFKKFNIEIGLLTRSRCIISKGECLRRSLLNKIQEGKILITIGTHALIQQKVSFKKLALAIVDEQHRFGVEQRKILKEKGGEKIYPHFLSMTATPIPRSLALTLYGDLDLTIIDELPPGRKKVITQIIPPFKRKETYNFIRDQIKKGRQAFVVCPLIDPSDKLGVTSVNQEYEKLSQNIFPEFKIAFLHGRLSSKEKEKIMTEFSQGKTDILVATPVVEVGIDVPQATLMIIEGAERFGLAQLHQFRGRVRRSKYQAYCFLFTENPTSQSLKRLRALIESDDGFALAEKDLSFRGPGELYGRMQHGFPEFKIATLFDHKIIKEARESVVELLNKDPDLKFHPLILAKISKEQVHLE